MIIYKNEKKSFEELEILEKLVNFMEESKAVTMAASLPDYFILTFNN